MLKWLVQQPAKVGTTEDPLAVLELGKGDAVYAVTRTNPLFTEDSNEHTVLEEKLSASDASSGYLSAETHKHDDNHRVDHDDARQNEDVQEVSSALSQGSAIRLETNPKFVTSISTSDGLRPGNIVHVAKHPNFVKEVQVKMPLKKKLVKRKDSLVTDSLLHLTNPEHLELVQMSSTDSLSSGLPLPESDVDLVIRQLSEAVTRSHKINVVSKAVMDRRGQSAISRRSSRLRGSLRALRKHQGIYAMRELWQRTGMRTNGRKLLVQAQEESDNNFSFKLANLSENIKKEENKEEINKSDQNENNENNKNLNETTKESHKKIEKEEAESRFVDGWVSEDTDGSTTSSATMNKRVTFSRDVVDRNEAWARPKLLNAASLERNDSGTHHWEKFYGNQGKFAGSYSQANNDYRRNQVVDSRRKGSEVVDLEMGGHSRLFTANSDARSNKRLRREVWCGQCVQSTVLIVLSGLIVAVVVTIVLYIFAKQSWDCENDEKC